MKDANPAVRLVAVEGLRVAPDPQSADALAEMFRTQQDAALLRAALKAIALSKPQSAAGFVGEILKNAEANAALVPDAIGMAEKVGGGEMAKVLGDAVPSLGAAAVQAVEALSRMKGAPVVPVASRLLGDTARPTEVCRAAAAALGGSQSADAVEPLLKVSAAPAVRREVILALASIPDIRALDVYLDGLGGKDGTVRQHCRNAIKAVAGQALPKIEAKLDATTFST